MHIPSTKTLPLGDTTIRYLDAGSGSAVVLAHCSGASHRQWAFLLPSLVRGHRVLAPDFLGHGGSSPWPLTGPPPRVEDAQVLEALIARAGNPVHLVGHSYGAAVALEVARRDQARLERHVLSLCLIEPVAFHVLRNLEATQHWDQVLALGARIRESVGGGDLFGAARVFISFWLGRGRWFLLPRKVRARVAGTMPKVAADFARLIEQSESLADHAGIEGPVTLVRGTRSPGVAKAVVEALAVTLPDARVVELSGAGHMSPLTHPSRVHDLVIAHLARAPARVGSAGVAGLQRLSA